MTGPDWLQRGIWMRLEEGLQKRKKSGAVKQNVKSHGRRRRGMEGEERGGGDDGGAGEEEAVNEEAEALFFTERGEGLERMMD